MNNSYERLSCNKVWLLQQRQDGASMFFPGWISTLTGLVLSPEVHTNNHCNTWMELKMSRLYFFCINTANFTLLSLSITSAIPSTWCARFNTCEFYHPLLEKIHNHIRQRVQEEKEVGVRKAVIRNKQRRKQEKHGLGGIKGKWRRTKTTQYHHNFFKKLSQKCYLKTPREQAAKFTLPW